MSVTIAPDVAYSFMLIFVRLAAMLMLMPAIGEASIPGRIRIAFAIGLTVILYPVVAPQLTPPEGLVDLVLALGYEVLIGVFIGGVARMLMSAMQMAGAFVAFQIGLASAQIVDPSQGIQSALFASFLSVVAVTLVFAFDLHHLLIRAIGDSYTLFKPGFTIPTGDFASLAVDYVAQSFRIAIQLSAPFLVFGLVFYVGLGILSRLMPQVQVFFVAMPANTLLGFVLLMALIGSMGLWFAEYFASAIEPFRL